MTKPIALVTGASRGIGHEIAKSLLQKGYDVYGTSRHADKLSEDENISGVHFLTMDLMQPDTIDAVISQFEDIDLLVNNAGHSQIGSVEEITDEKMNEIFTINFYSQVRLIKGFLPIMRKKRSGTIINVTSMAGTNPMPFSTMYAASKGAFNKLSQGLRHELASFNIKVIAIAPLYANTAIQQNQDYGKDSPYKKGINSAKQSRRRQLNTSAPPSIIANQVMKIISLKNPKPHYTTGKNAGLMGFLMRHMPQKFIERILRKRFGLKN